LVRIGLLLNAGLILLYAELRTIKENITFCGVGKINEVKRRTTWFNWKACFDDANKAIDGECCQFEDQGRFVG
jgi:hypothetical protein